MLESYDKGVRSAMLMRKLDLSCIESIRGYVSSRDRLGGGGLTVVGFILHGGGSRKIENPPNGGTGGKSDQI